MFENKALRRIVGRERDIIIGSATASSTLWFLESIVMKSSQTKKTLRTKGIHFFGTWSFRMRNRWDTLGDKCLQR
jgi:hypothetical protein